MTTYYRTLEIADAGGTPTGKFRKVEHNSSMSRMHGLCDHEHDTEKEADECPDIQAEMNRVFPKRTTCTRCGQAVAVTASLTDSEGKSVGQVAFEAYDKERGGLNHQGNPTPAWDDLPEGIRTAWQVAGEAAQEV